MSSINRSRTRATRTPRATTGATGAAAATSTTAATNSTAGAAAQPPVPSGAGQISNAKKAVVNGFGGKRPSMPTNAVRRFAGDTAFNHYAADGTGKVDRGFIKVSADPTANGCRITVDTFHKTKNDGITLFLMAEVLDTKTKQMRTITLGILCENEKINGNSYRGQRSFDLSYDEVNKWLKARNPGLKLNPGHTPLSVAARFKSGHQAGGPGRGGAFRTPFATGAQNATATRIGNLSGVRGEQTDLPLDMQVGYSADLTRAYPMLKPGGSIVSRLESEFKGTTDKQDMTRAVKQMYAMVEKIHSGDKSEVENILGKDWTVETVSRYWLKDDGAAGAPGKAGAGFFKGFRVDDAGLPIQDPMRDQYMDDKNLSMTQHEGAIRLRTNKQATFINIKPGGGRIDDSTGIRQRVEVGLELKPDTDVKDAGRFLQGVSTNARYANTVYNHAQREVRKFDPNIQLADSLNPFMEVTQDRHKFTLKNEKTGVEIEFSFDFVTAKTTRPEHANADGTPQVIEFCVLEGELDHLQLQSANASSFQAAGASSSSFSDDKGQDKWLKATSDKVTMDVDPRLHEVEDLKNKSFRTTESYAAFEVANEKMMAHVFPGGLKPGKQKAAHAATLLSLVVTDKRSMKAAVKRQFRSMGLKWSPTMEKAVTKRLGTEDGLKEMNSAFQKFDKARDIKGYVKSIVGSGRAPAVDYDPKALTRMVKTALEDQGLAITDEIKALIKKVNDKHLDPIALHKFMAKKSVSDGSNMMNMLRRGAGLRGKSPVPGFSPTKMLAMYEKGLSDSWVSPDDHAEIKKYIAAAHKKGASIHNIRNALQYGGGNDYYFRRLAQSTGVTAPKLTADKAKVVGGAAAALGRNGFQMTPVVTKFFEDVAAHKSPSEAQSFVGSLSRSDFKRFIDKAAKDMGVSPPKLTHDWSTIDDTLKSAAAASNVKFDAKLKAFAHKVIEGGESPTDVENFVGRLWAQTPDKAKRSARMKVPAGLNLPDVSFYVADTEKALTASMDKMFLDDEAALLKFADKLIDSGEVAPGQIVALFERAKTGDLTAALKTSKITLPAGISAPTMTFDVDAYLTHLEKDNASTRGKVTPEFAKYVKKAFAKAQKQAAFDVSKLKRGTASNLAKKLSALSGLAVPAGI